MSLVYHYKFDQSDVTLDSSGANRTLAQDGNVTSVTDATFGKVAYFDGSSGLFRGAVDLTFSSIRPRTFSTWIKKDVITDLRTVYAYGGSTGCTRYYGGLPAGDDSFSLASTATATGVTSPPALGVGQWAHVVSTYSNSLDTLSVYINGVLEASATMSASGASPNTPFYIGYNPYNPTSFDNFIGCMSDFRGYNFVMDASAIAQLFADGPNNGKIPAFNVTPFTHLADLEWTPVDCAATYTVTSIRDGGSEEALTTMTERLFVAKNLVPGSSYEFRVYSDLDLVTAFFTETVSIPSVDASSVGSLLQRIVNDLTVLSVAEVGEIDSLLDAALSTGDTVTTSLGSTTFVKTSETLTLPDEQKVQVLTPFEQSLGAGQTVSIVLPDTSTNVITYDETLDEVSVGGVSYTVGTSFVLGGQKVTATEI